MTQPALWEVMQQSNKPIFLHLDTLWGGGWFYVWLDPFRMIHTIKSDGGGGGGGREVTPAASNRNGLEGKRPSSGLNRGFLCTYVY